ncbi:MAG: hypothetical protein GY839_20895 [candidate division Zixibacteria bacterium]|nr:hypothetical protein [candidate division Zixibacteria bacterium]
MKKSEKLSHRAQLVSIVTISMIAIVIIVGAALKKRPKLVVVEATADQIIPADTIPEAIPEVEEVLPQIEKVFHDSGRLEILSGEKLYTITKDSSGWTEPLASEFGAFASQMDCMVYEEEQVVIGGEKLIISGYDYLELYDEYDLGQPVNVVLDFGEGYLVGANDGLHYFDADRKDTLLKQDILVTSLTEDAAGLWVGTFGDGLWKYDGEKWQRRYLTRDTSIFDFVNTLEYNYPHVWVGTPSGIFKFNGGSWNQLFVSDSSEVYEVNCFLPRVLNTYVGTNQGLFVYANDSLQAVPDFQDTRIVGLFKDGKDILVATRESGIFTLKGKEEILRPEQLPTSQPVWADAE